MSDGKVQSPVDLTETQQQTIPRTETNRHQNSIRKIRNSDRPADNSRRSFMGKAGGLTAMAVAAAMVPFEPLVGGKETEAAASDITYSESNRANLSFNYRDKEAQAEKVSPPVAADNGDFALYTDHSGAWSKTLQHTNLGIVNPTSFNSLITALTNGDFADFQNILVGNPGGTNVNAQLNGPQTELAFDLEGLDSHATVLDPSPAIPSAQTADEEVELIGRPCCAT